MMLPAVESRLLIGELKFNSNNSNNNNRDGSVLCQEYCSPQKINRAKNGCRLNFRKFYKDYVLKGKYSTELSDTQIEHKPTAANNTHCCATQEFATSPTFDLPSISGQQSVVNWVMFDNDCEELLRHESRCNSVSSCDSEDQPTKGTQYKKPSTYRERAPWEKPEEGEGGGFDEKEFLMGRVPLVGSRDQAPAGRFSKIPSKAFQRLTRSMSREVSPSLDTTSDYLSSDDVDDYQSDSGSSRGRGGDMRYKGNYIPSKTFHKLRRSMDRRSAEPDQNFQQGPYNMEDDYVSDAVEEVTIENNDPETYLENLKQSMQSNPVRIEPQAEATDF